MTETTKARGWTRRHDNGWVGIVCEVKEIGRFVGGALPPGEPGSVGDYATIDRAKMAADSDARELGSHPTCSDECESWPN